MTDMTPERLNALRADAVNLAAERSPFGHPLPDAEIRAAWAGVDATLTALRTEPATTQAGPELTDDQIEAAALAGARARRGVTAKVNDADREVARAVLAAAVGGDR